MLSTIADLLVVLAALTFFLVVFVVGTYVFISVLRSRHETPPVVPGDVVTFWVRRRQDGPPEFPVALLEAIQERRGAVIAVEAGVDPERVHVLLDGISMMIPNEFGPAHSFLTTPDEKEEMRAALALDALLTEEVNTCSCGLCQAHRSDEAQGCECKLCALFRGDLNPDDDEGVEFA